MSELSTYDARACIVERRTELWCRLQLMNRAAAGRPFTRAEERAASELWHEMQGLAAMLDGNRFYVRMMDERELTGAGDD